MYLALGILFLIVIILLFRWRVSEFIGEESFESYLKQLSNMGTVLEDLVLDNQTTVPYVFISKQGIFNIYYNPELTGRLYGRDTDATWSHVMGHRKMNFPNPIRSIEGQRDELNKISASLDVTIPVYDVLCFSKRVVLKINTLKEVVYLKDFVKAIEQKPEVLKDYQLNDLMNRINS